MAGIYIHIPFCYKRCDYCDFYKTTNISLKTDFLTVLDKEITKYASFISSQDIKTIYFGGGTPSVLEISEVKRILDTIYSKIKDRRGVKEITFELNPDDGDLQYLKGLRETGINRLSIGIQSFDDDLLQVLNRRHNSYQAENVVENSRKVGFKNISVDLMYGLPGMSMEKWNKTIDKVLSLGVEHISAYHLTYEPGTVFGKKLENGIFTETPEEESVKQFKVLIEKLKNAGYEHYEVSNFSMPGKRSLHNSNYWNSVKYLGLGPSAHSFDGSKRWWNVSSIGKYLKGEFVENEEILTETDRYNELVMLKLRTAEGISTEKLKGAGERYHSFFKANIEKHISSGNVKFENERYFITQKGIFISDYIISELFYE